MAMTSVVDYWEQLVDLCTTELTELRLAGSSGDSSRIVKATDTLYENRDVPIQVFSTFTYDCAQRSHDPDLKRYATERYLITKCTEALDMERLPLPSLAQIFDALRSCGVSDQCRDAALAMARILLIDDNWHYTLQLSDTVLDWLQAQWASVLASRHSVIKKRTIGNVAATMKALLHDVQSQCSARGRETTKHLEARRFQQFDGSLGEAIRYLSGIFNLLSRRERRLAEQQLRLWSEVRRRISAEGDRTRIVSTAEDARVLLRETRGNLSQLLECGEFALLNMCVPIQAQLLSHIKGEMKRWAVSAPNIKISPERLVYPFPNNADRILLLIENTSDIPVDTVVILDAMASNASLSPDGFEVHDFSSGEKVVHEVEVGIPAGCQRVAINWLAEFSDEFGVKNESKGNIQIEVDRGTAWEEIENRPNPYPTDPIRSPERLYGRENILRDLLRVARSGESRYLTGQRRVGKTSVARVLVESLDKDHFIAVYAPWGEIGGKSFEVVCWQLCNRLHEEAARVQSDLEAINPPLAAEFERGFNQATVGYIRRIHTTSRRNIIIILDDFDDVPEWVYSGETGDLFFSMLKTLTGSRGISLIFVGGQRLRTIMQSSVAGKLNQVTPIDLGYVPEEAMPQLVRDPTKDVLQFADSAVNRIIYLSACNPFYANRICNRLWDYMVERRWKYVVAEDVERVANSTVAHDDSPLFSHFWMDGIWGQGEVQEGGVNSNRAILYAFGRLGATEPDAVYFHFNDIKRECPYLMEHELQKWLGDLVTRGVVEVRQDLPFHYTIRTPYFQLWLAGRGQAELYSSFDPTCITLLQKPEEEVATDEELEALVGGQGIRYRTGLVGVYEIRKFLKQFGSVVNQRGVYKLVEKLVKDGFFRREEVQEAAAMAVAALSRNAAAARPGFVASLTDSGVWKNMFVVVPSGSSITSFHALADIVRQKENLAKTQTGTAVNLVDYIRRQKMNVAVLMFDDVIGTGTTAYTTCKELLDTIDNDGLSERVAYILFYAVVGFRDVVGELNRRLAGKVVVEVYRQLAEADQAFNPDAGIFDTDDEREQTQKLVESIGSKLEPKQPLGYGGRQALIAFSRNTPNITLPIFYKLSRKRDFNWQPLFRRM